MVACSLSSCKGALRHKWLPNMQSSLGVSFTHLARSFNSLVFILRVPLCISSSCTKLMNQKKNQINYFKTTNNSLLNTVS